MQILVLLFFVVFACCSGGISRNDINLEVTHLLKHCFEKLSEQQQATSLPTCGGDGIHGTSSLRIPDLVSNCLFLVSSTHLAVGSKKEPSILPRSLPSTAHTTSSRSAKNCSADRSHDSLVVLFDVLPNLTSKIAACPFLSSSLNSQIKANIF